MHIRYARTNAANNMRSRIFIGGEQRTEDRGQRTETKTLSLISVLCPLSSVFCLLSSRSRLVLNQILVDVVVRGRALSIAKAVGAEFAHGVGERPALILHAIDRGQGADAREAGHAVDENRVICWIVAQFEEVVDDLRPMVWRCLVPREKSAISGEGEELQTSALLGADLALGSVGLAPIARWQERVGIFILKI